jgi:hypothetical protein
MLTRIFQLVSILIKDTLKLPHLRMVADTEGPETNKVTFTKLSTVVSKTFLYAVL